MKQIVLDMSRYTTPKSKQTWSGVDVADYFKKYFDIPNTGAFGYSSWLRRIKIAGVKQYHAEKLVMIMQNREKWLKETKNETMHRGKWMFNRFRFEIKEVGIDKYISSQL